MILNKISEKWLSAFINNPVATCIIETKNEPMISREIIKYISDKLKIDKNLVNLQEFEEEKSIKIEDVRQTQKSLQLKANKSSNISRIIAFTDAQRLTVEAQNALLKLIEELPANTVLILCVNNKEDLINTIVSRSFIIPILPVDFTTVVDSYNKITSDKKLLKKLYILSDGYPNKISNLLNNVENDKYNMQTAKNYLSSKTHEKIKYIEDNVTSKENSYKFLNDLEIISKSGMRYSKSNNDINKWKHNYKTIIGTKKLLNSNVSTKLALLNLSVELA